MDKRIGQHFLNAGPGFGGSCFKKDISNLIYICEYYGLKEVSVFWQKVIDINIWQPKRITKLIVNKLFGTLSGKYISILGFSFKANTNDIRESPAIKICNDLIEEGAVLKIYDPKVKKSQISKNINSSNWIYVKNIRESIENSNAVIIMTEWDEFRNIDWSSLFDLMKKPPWVFDTRSITNIEEARKCGFNIWVVGNGKYQ